MKTKNFLLSIACSVAIFSCTKNSDKPAEHSVVEPGKSTASVKYAVNFNLGKVDVENAGRTGNKEIAASEYLYNIFYGAYDSTGRLISKIIQDRRDKPFPHFGEISDSLPEGKYTIIVAGGGGDVAFGDTSRLEALLIGNNLTDGFFKKTSINVVKTDSAQNNVMKLDRMTSILEVHLKDTLPQNIAGITVSVDSVPAVFFALTGAIANVSQVYTDVPNTPNQAFYSTYYLMGSDMNLRVTIRAYTALKQVVLKKVIDNVYLRPNTKVILQGTLSDGIVDNTGSTVITIDPDYTETNTIDF